MWRPVRALKAGVLAASVCAAGYLPAAGGPLPTVSLAAGGESPPDPPAVQVDGGSTTVMPLGGGASLTVPAGAIDHGATVRASYRGAPEGAASPMALLGHSIDLQVEPPDAIRAPVTLRFAVPDGVPAGLDPAVSLGVARFNAATRGWEPVTSRYDPVRRQVVASVAHFSWYNPFSWDWADIGAAINQGIGQVLGKRSGGASCQRGQPVPGWVASTPGVTNQPAVAVRSCAEGEGDVLAVELVNNRPYGMTVSYGGAVRWGWHEPGASGIETARNRFADRIAAPRTLYLPPLSRASVGIQPMDGGSAGYAIGLTRHSLLADIAAYLAPELPSGLPAGACASFLARAPLRTVPSPGDLLELVRDIANCLSAAAALAGTAQDRLVATAGALRAARTVGAYWLVADVIWRLADLFVDTVVIGGRSELGAGFSVFAKRRPPPAPPAPPPPAPPPPAAAPPPPAAPPGCPGSGTFARLDPLASINTHWNLIKGPKCVGNWAVAQFERGDSQPPLDTISYEWSLLRFSGGSWQYAGGAFIGFKTYEGEPFGDDPNGPVYSFSGMCSVGAPAEIVAFFGGCHNPGGG